MIKRYRITWTEKAQTTTTIDNNITADDSEIAALAERGKFRYVVI